MKEYELHTLGARHSTEPIYDGNDPNRNRAAAAYPTNAKPSDLIAALRSQRQIDAHGTEVGVSRQAVDEAIATLESLAAPVSAVPEGYKLVPIEPTSEMLDAGCEQHKCEQGDPWYSASQLCENECADIYHSMLAVAPGVKS